MDDLNFKFIYNGESFFLELVEDIKKNIDINKIGILWNGWIKIESEGFWVVKMHFFSVLYEIKNILKDKKKYFCRDLSLSLVLI